VFLGHGGHLLLDGIAEKLEVAHVYPLLVS
jgi:hypothetical protein